MNLFTEKKLISFIVRFVTIPGTDNLACDCFSFSEMPILDEILSSPEHLRFVIEM